jgi:hydrogenase maturation protein HypF
VSTVALSGGVFQNELLKEDLADLLRSTPFAVWSNREVPANDGGISLGQAALAARSGIDLASASS